MSEEKTYLASDLVTELGVPRSTVNDWLTRYADYLESEPRGKRRVYTARSLEVLRHVAELRNNNASSFEIEQRLTGMFGVQPEVSVPAPNEPAAPSPEVPAEENLPMARPMFDEMNTRIAGEFGQLAEKLTRFEAERRAFSRRLWWMFAVVFFIFALAVLLLGYCAYYLYGELNERTAEADRKTARLTDSSLRLELLQQENEIRRKQAEEKTRQQVDELSMVLDKNRAYFRQNLEKLSGELAEQRKQYETQLAQMEKNAAAQNELQLRKAREDFAREQLEKLKEISRQQGELSVLRQKQDAREQEIAALKKQLAELEKELAEEKKKNLQPPASSPASSPTAEESL